jgi:hypothetical protein
MGRPKPLIQALKRESLHDHRAPEVELENLLADAGKRSVDPAHQAMFSPPASQDRPAAIDGVQIISQERKVRGGQGCDGNDRHVINPLPPKAGVGNGNGTTEPSTAGRLAPPVCLEMSGGPQASPSPSSQVSAVADGAQALARRIKLLAGLSGAKQ